MSERQPALFISHGAPTLAIDDSPAARFLSRLGERLPHPRGIVVASAHWETDTPCVTTAPHPETIHDFGGFPQELHEIRYPAPGAPELAVRVRTLLQGSRFSCDGDAERGLDHGAWVPLSLMFPAAEVPVIQVSIQPEDGPAHHRDLGRALAQLRDEGVLVIGSGSLTHNLGEFFARAADAQPPAWTVAFRDWIAGCLSAGDTAALIDYRARAPEAARNHPTEEHLLPLFVALGAGGRPARGSNLHTSYSHGVLSMDVWRFDGDPGTDG